MSLANNAIFSDTNNSLLLTGVKTITTAQTLLCVGASNATKRQILRIYNKGSSTIYIGASGLTKITGEPLLKNQSFTIHLRKDLSLYALTASGTNDVIIWEIG